MKYLMVISPPPNKKSWIQIHFNMNLTKNKLIPYYYIQNKCKIEYHVGTTVI